jgi:glycosyltransferase involved in cell wall biosynthesis
MRLVVVTQQVDPAHPILGATVAKLHALAARVDELVVLADAAVPGTLPANCRVRLFASASRAGRGLRFEHALVSELVRRPRPAAVLAHMCPIYAVLAAPLARPLGTRVLLWFAHWNRTRTLDSAVRLSNAVLSVDTRSVPVRSSKVAGIGHGIVIEAFPCVQPNPVGGLRALALGRYSTAKGLAAIVRGVGLAREAGLDVRLSCHGAVATAAEQADRDALARLVAELGLAGAVLLGDPVPRDQVPGLLADADVLVNNMRSGAPDKVVYEACAACIPVIVSNPLFDELLDDLEPPLRFRQDDAADLAMRFSALASLDAAGRAEIGTTLRERVKDRHSVDSWADAVVRHARSAA